MINTNNDITQRQDWLGQQRRQRRNESKKAWLGQQLKLDQFFQKLYFRDLQVRRLKFVYIYSFMIEWNINTDMHSEKDLTQIKERIATFKQIHLYNRKIADIYLLVSHGLVQSNKKATPSAICSNPECGLTIEFDTGQDSNKEELELAVKDHDQDCCFRKIKGNIVNLSLFKLQGSKIYNERSASFKERGVWIQLKPEEILQVMNIKHKNNLIKANDSNIVLQEFMHLDASISRESLNKVSSVVFLAIFGWKWVQQTVIGCQFCSSLCEARDFISPSQYSLMKVQEGFCFKSSHKSWCCLVEPSKEYWKEILRQAALVRLAFLPSSFSKSSNYLKLRSIQRKSIQIYDKQIRKLNSMKKRISQKREEMIQKWKWSGQIKEQLQNKMNKLQVYIEGQKLLGQEFIRKMSNINEK